MGKAYLAATAAMLIAIAGYFAVVRYAPSDLVFFLGLAIPFSGGAVGAYLAPIKRFTIGFSTALAAILLLALGGYVGGILGFGDFIGFQGTIIATVLSIPIVTAASAVGALFGEWLSQIQART